MPLRRERCPVCGQSVSIRVNGTIVTHYKRGAKRYVEATQCSGSRTLLRSIKPPENPAYAPETPLPKLQELWCGQCQENSFYYHYDANGEHLIGDDYGPTGQDLYKILKLEAAAKSAIAVLTPLAYNPWIEAAVNSLRHALDEEVEDNDLLSFYREAIKLEQHETDNSSVPLQ